MSTLAVAAWLILQACCFLAALLWQEQAHAAERRDLYSRIAARDLGEYASATASPRPAPPNPVRAAIDAARRRTGASTDPE